MPAWLRNKRKIQPDLSSVSLVSVGAFREAGGLVLASENAAEGVDRIERREKKAKKERKKLSKKKEKQKHRHKRVRDDG